MHQDQEIPADLILLSSSDADNLCYVETANLDGETNLKLKYCYAGTAKFKKPFDLIPFSRQVISCELPNERQALLNPVDLGFCMFLGAIYPKLCNPEPVSFIFLIASRPRDSWLVRPLKHCWILYSGFCG